VEEEGRDRAERAGTMQLIEENSWGSTIECSEENREASEL
jgi:hypothetical protein